jgi:hypothetical protein
LKVAWGPRTPDSPTSFQPFGRRLSACGFRRRLCILVAVPANVALPPIMQAPVSRCCSSLFPCGDGRRAFPSLGRCRRWILEAAIRRGRHGRRILRNVPFSSGFEGINLTSQLSFDFIFACFWRTLCWELKECAIGSSQQLKASAYVVPCQFELHRSGSSSTFDRSFKALIFSDSSNPTCHITSVPWHIFCHRLFEGKLHRSSGQILFAFLVFRGV